MVYLFNKGKAIKKILILASSGTGKTIAAELFENVVDIDTIDYMFWYNIKHFGTLKPEELKNIINNWIANSSLYPKGSIKFKYISGSIKFMSAVFKALKNNIVLIPLIPETYKVAHSVFKNTRKIFVLPEKDNFEEYKKRFIKRGNDENFIRLREDEHDKIIKLLKLNNDAEIIFLPKGKYLSDILKDFGANPKAEK